MPIVDVEIVGVRRQEREFTQRLADALGEAFGSGPRGTWVRVRYLDAAMYAENAGAEPGITPVFVSVLRADNPEGPALAALAERLCKIVAEVCEKPSQHVHLTFEPAARGRIAFGGRLRT